MPTNLRGSRSLALLLTAIALTSWVASPRAQQPQNPHTAARANSYDDTWQHLWVEHARALLAGTNKTDGFVLQVGDSITHSMAYAAWPRYPVGATTEDAAVLSWVRAGTWGIGTADVTNRNGWYLAGADTTGWRGMTSVGGGSIQEVLWGCCNGDSPAMPVSTEPDEARRILASPTYVHNLQIDTVVSAFSDAQFAVVMLGTNDPANPQNFANLTTILDKLEAQRIVPILSTIPPRADAYGNDVNVQLNSAIVQLARSRSLPLIDFYAEVLLRRPGTSWLGTLISTDGVHPTGNGGGFGVNSDPYLPGGDPASRTSGDALLNVGYLLRSWLVVQKLIEVKQSVIDQDASSNVAPTVALTSPTAAATYVAPASITIAATADDSDGTIARVEFYANSTLLGSTATSPYQFAWTSVPAGTYTVIARAVDNAGASSDSSTVTVTIAAQSTVHIGDLDASSSVVNKQGWRGTVGIVVHDSSERGLHGAVVTGQWSGAYAGTATCSTDLSGSCTVVTGTVNGKSKATAATFTVTAVSRPNSVYQSGANHDVDGGSNGSAISVRTP